MYQRMQLYWQQPDYEDDDPTDEDVEELEAYFLDDDEDAPEFIESQGMTFCYACGILACPGEEEFDWCDHRTGQGCYHMKSSPFNEDRDARED